MSEIAQESRVHEIGGTDAIEGTEIEFGIIPEREAKEVIERYIHEYPGCTTSEIIENVKLDPSLVVAVLNLLEEEGKVKSEEIK